MARNSYMYIVGAVYMCKSVLSSCNTNTCSGAVREAASPDNLLTKNYPDAVVICRNDWSRMFCMIE
eukprot:6603516-Pyramimonas_sp.AAC.1